MPPIPATNPFRLTPVGEGRGVSCDIRGCYIDNEPLLTRSRDTKGRETWTARPQAELEDALSTRYGHPIDMSAKTDGLAAIADALNRGDVFGAQLGTLALKLPHPPAPAFTGFRSPRLTELLDSSDMLRRRQKPIPHAANDCKGCSSSANNGNAALSRYEEQPRINPVQEFLTLPDIWEMPWARPWIRPAPPAMPWDFYRPGPVRPDMPWYGPNYYERRDGASPTPGEPEDADCKQIRAEAEERCEKELDGVQYGRDYKYRDIEHCMDSEVPERCGGHHYERYRPKPPRRPPLSA
jgi:hypothetical protein